MNFLRWADIRRRSATWPPCAQTGRTGRWRHGRREQARADGGAAGDRRRDRAALARDATISCRPASAGRIRPTRPCSRAATWSSPRGRLTTDRPCPLHRQPVVRPPGPCGNCASGRWRGRKGYAGHRAGQHSRSSRGGSPSEFESARDMLKAVVAALPADVFVAAAGRLARRVQRPPRRSKRERRARRRCASSRTPTSSPKSRQNPKADRRLLSVFRRRDGKRHENALCQTASQECDLIVASVALGTDFSAARTTRSSSSTFPAFSRCRGANGRSPARWFGASPQC